MGGYYQGQYHQYICDKCGIGLPQKRNTINFGGRIFCRKCWNVVKVQDYKNRSKIKELYPDLNK